MLRNAFLARARASLGGRATVAFAGLFGLLGLVGCASFGAGSQPPSEITASRDWVVVSGMRLQSQTGKTGCGPAALGMVLDHWGVSSSPPTADGSQGVRAAELRDRARQLGLESFVLPGTVEDLRTELAAGHPVVVGIARRERLHAYLHYVVVAGANRDLGEWLIADPDRGWTRVGLDELLAEWNATNRVMIVAYPKLGTISSVPAVHSGDERPASTAPVVF